MTQTTAPVINLNYDHRHQTRVAGDITVIFTWIITTGRPCMVLVPTSAGLTHERITPCIVPMEHAYLWDENVGDGRHCAIAAYQFAASLGFNPNNPQTLVRITSIVREHLGDLLTMPQEPDFDRPVMAEITKTDTETGKTEEAEIMGDV